MMMNKRRSSKIELSKYVFILPVMILAGATFTVSNAEVNIERVIEKVQRTELISAPIVASLKNGVDGILDEGGKVDTNMQENKPYPLLHPSFNREDLEKKNMHYQIDGKLVSLDEFLAFPRTEIYAVDIYKDRQEIFKKIGKEHSEGLIVMTSKKGMKDIVLGPKNKVKPLLVLDGKELPQDFDIQSLDPTSIERVEVFKDASAIEKYGDKGKEGVVLITSKSLSMGAKNLKGDILGVKVVAVDTTKTERGKIVIRNGGGQDGAKPLYIVDGKILNNEFAINSLPPEEIESISVLKDKSATAIYGDKGKNGVILITSKSEASKSEFNKSSDSLYNGKVSEITVIGYANKKPDMNRNSTVDLDSQPEPLGGMVQFRKWIGDNYNYPEAAINAHIKGTVQVSFIVEKDGSLSHVNLVRDLGYGTGENAVLLVKKSPRWKPGVKDGQPVRVEYTLPIRLDVMAAKK